MQPSTQWYVITGAPSSGKTTTVNALKERGYATTIEHARHYIDTKRDSGKTVEEIRSDQLAFQHGILDMQIEQERALARHETIFLDRALPDAVAYYRFQKLEPDQKLIAALKHASYKKVFILDPLPLAADYARIEDTAAQKELHQLLTETYEAMPAPVVHVPVLSVDKRVDFILQNL